MVLSLKRLNLAMRAMSIHPHQAGFLGSLTTMSTFMSEVVGNRDRHARWWSYVYLVATAIAAQAPALIVGATLK